MTKTDVLSIEVHDPSRAVIDRTVSILQSGGIVVAPTETRYGLLARADHDDVLDELCRVKKRSHESPIAVFVKTPPDIDQIGFVSPAANLLIRSFLPGPLTVVLKSVVNWPPPLVVDGKIGVRCSSSRFIQEVLNRIEFPITATSANLSGGVEHDNVRNIMNELSSEVKLYIDGGPLSGATSTVVDCSHDELRILRSGAISISDIEQALKGIG